MIVFLSCVKTKQDHRCRADEMYVSPLFKLSLRYAKSLNPRKIFILSAKYGLLELNDVIDPYELTLNHMGEREETLGLRHMHGVGKEGHQIHGKGRFLMWN